MTSTCPVIVFAKAPMPGYAKTRLARALGADGAARLAARMLAETLNNAVAAGIGPVELCCAPDDTHPAFRQALAAHPVTLTRQGDGDLGVRMHRALARNLAHHGRAVLIGTDAPGLTATYLRNAAQALQTVPAVFAPAVDGGYALIGLSKLLPGLFDDMPWSTPAVMAQTRDRLRRLHVAHTELPEVHDVDEPADLRHVPGGWLI